MESWICRFKDAQQCKCPGGPDGPRLMVYCSLGYGNPNAKKKKNVTSSCFTWDVKTDRSQQLGEAMYFIDMLFQTQLIG